MAEVVPYEEHTWLARRGAHYQRLGQKQQMATHGGSRHRDALHDASWFRRPSMFFSLVYNDTFEPKLKCRYMMNMCLGHDTASHAYNIFFVVIATHATTSDPYAMRAVAPTQATV